MLCLLVLIALVLVLYYYPWKFSPSESYTHVEVEEIDPAKAKENVRRGAYDVIIDARTKEEREQGYAPGTISIPIGELVSKLPEIVPDKSTRILFICKKGIRAGGAAFIAKKLGYENVQSMIGNYKDLE